MHGWGITLHIERISNEILRVEEGSLYPALHRMEQERLIASEWGVSENNRRARFYRLTASGRKQLGAEQENWRRSQVRSRLYWISNRRKNRRPPCHRSQCVMDEGRACHQNCN